MVRLGTSLIKTEDALVETQDPLEEINLRTSKEPRVTYISSLLLDDLKSKFKKLLEEFKDFFV